ncbi:phage tail protein [Rhodoplanes sp. TEM]|uniref:Phage tail protein n=1 Tax=Rhodoplanes tepidamans TaxID=200616 RepID=A0ABT5J535_RHOTP|nr:MULTISPECIES: phage tail protein [Rhodoplanes]MDC7784756.1 phage tail protein [Rhodoplanes tepidamans]MDC7982223.1 phage tail protein [Rhodoplanes sp. TEM]MDQ0356230.1 phage tail sheath protein FI [Rhodoplanes tepidamans]
MTEPTFGIVFNRDDTEPRPAVDSDLSVVGIAAPAPMAADGIGFYDPIEFNSDDVTTINAIGNGVVRDALDGINDQLAEFQRAARVVFVRTEHSTSTDPVTKLNEETADIVGDSTAGTGMHALLKAGQKLAVIPRLIMFPGYTAHQSAPDEANPVCAEATGVLNKLLGVAVIGGPATSKQAFIDWRETLQSDRLIPLASTVKIATQPSGTIERPAEGRIIGIGVRRDYEKNGKPFHSWANQPVQGIVAPNRFIDFSLTDGATEGQELLAANAGVILRGQVGMETAIASGGFVFVGTDTLSEDSLWQFYNQVRGRDFIHLLLLKTLRYYLGRFNLTGQTIQAVMNTMEFALRDLKAEGHILGYQVTFTKDKNSPEQLRTGKFTVRFAAEEPAPLRKLVIESARYRAALDAMLDELLTQLQLGQAVS